MIGVRPMFGTLMSNPGPWVTIMHSDEKWVIEVRKKVLPERNRSAVKRSPRQADRYSADRPAAGMRHATYWGQCVLSSSLRSCLCSAALPCRRHTGRPLVIDSSPIHHVLPTSLHFLVGPAGILALDMPLDSGSRRRIQLH